MNKDELRLTPEYKAEAARVLAAREHGYVNDGVKVILWIKRKFFWLCLAIGLATAIIATSINEHINEGLVAKNCPDLVSWHMIENDEDFQHLKKADQMTVKQRYDDYRSQCIKRG